MKPIHLKVQEAKAYKSSCAQWRSCLAPTKFNHFQTFSEIALTVTTFDHININEMSMDDKM